MIRSIEALFGFLLLFSLIGCYENEEGCLDISATNFDVTADIPCPDTCCLFPNLRISFDNVLGYPPDTMYDYANDKYFDLPGMPEDSIAISRVRFFISDVELISDGTSFRVTDELEVYVNNSKVVVIDDFGLIEPQRSPEVTIGTFPYTGSFDEVRFSIGVDPDLVLLNTDSIPSNHTLSIQSDSTLWNVNTGYQTWYMELFTSQMATDSTLVLSSGKFPLSFTLDTPIEVPGGFDLILDFQLDWRSWFNDTNPAVDQNYELISKINNLNLSESFLFLQYRLQSN